jgi:hypothetical protein
MKGWLLGALCAAAMVAGAGHAAAKPVPEGGVTPDEIKGWLQDAGYKAVVKTEKDGHHHVTSAADGLNFDVYLYDCKGERCAAIQFYVGFDKGKDTPSLEKVNGYNRDKRFMRAYLDKDGGASFEFDVSVAPGGTWEALQDNFETFLGALPDIKKLVNW